MDALQHCPNSRTNDGSIFMNGISYALNKFGHIDLDCFNISIRKSWYNMKKLCEFENFWNYHANTSIGLYQS
jgi:hypothetical protein